MLKSKGFAFTDVGTLKFGLRSVGRWQSEENAAPWTSVSLCWWTPARAALRLWGSLSSSSLSTLGPWVLAPTDTPNRPTSTSHSGLFWGCSMPGGVCGMSCLKTLWRPQDLVKLRWCSRADCRSRRRYSDRFKQVFKYGFYCGWSPGLDLLGWRQGLLWSGGLGLQTCSGQDIASSSGAKVSNKFSTHSGMMPRTCIGALIVRT